MTAGPVEAASDPELDAVIALDPALAAAAEEHGRPPRWRRPPGFATLALQILEQQVSLGSAAAAFARLAVACGGEVSPAGVLERSDEELRAAGVSRQKARYLRALAAAVAHDGLDLLGLDALSDDEVVARLTALPGIGPWTADVHLLFVLERPDLFPVGDRALQVGAAEVLGLDEAPTAVELATIAERWAPHRSAAARVVWHTYLTRRGRTM